MKVRCVTEVTGVTGAASCPRSRLPEQAPEGRGNGRTSRRDLTPLPPREGAVTGATGFGRARTLVILTPGCQGRARARSAPRARDVRRASVESAPRRRVVRGAAARAPRSAASTRARTRLLEIAAFSPALPQGAVFLCDGCAFACETGRASITLRPTSTWVGGSVRGFTSPSPLCLSWGRRRARKASVC